MPMVPLQSMQQPVKSVSLTLLLLITKVINHLISKLLPPLKDGTSSAQVYTIDILDYNEFPVGPVTDSDDNANEVAENALPGAAVGITVFADDPEEAGRNPSVIPWVTRRRLIVFNIDSTSGIITVANPSHLDYETATSHSVDRWAIGDLFLAGSQHQYQAI